MEILGDQDGSREPENGLGPVTGVVSTSPGKILHDIVSALLAWRSKIGSEEFSQTWNDTLAFRGEEIQLLNDNGTALNGELLGLEADGSLRVKTDNKSLTVQIGEIHLRPAV